MIRPFRSETEGVSHIELTLRINDKESPMQIATLTVLVTLLMVPAPVFGQQVTQSRCGESLETATTGHVSSCLAASAWREAARLAKAQSSTAPKPATAPERSWAFRHPILLGTLIGLGAGAALALATPDCSSGGGDAVCGAYLGGYSALGAGIGAASGLVVAIARK